MNSLQIRNFHYIINVLKFYKPNLGKNKLDKNVNKIKFFLSLSKIDFILIKIKKWKM